MKSRLFLLAVVGFALLAPSDTFAQPSYDGSFFQALLDKTVTDTDFHTVGQQAEIEALMAKTGANQTWDFSALTFESSGPPTQAEYISLPAELLGSTDPGFADATYAVRIIDTGKQSGVPHAVLYFGLNSEGVHAFGSYYFDGQDIYPEVYDAPYLQLPFPFEFGAQWTSQAEYSFESGEPPPNDVVDVTIVRSGEVVGWGNLVTPAGTVAALMYDQTEVTYYGLFPLFTTHEIEFFSVDGIQASIDIVQEFPLQLEASYTVMSVGGGIQAPTDAPPGLNPAGGSTTSTTPTLTWGVTADATSYNLQVSDQPGISKNGSTGTIVINETGLGSTVYDVVTPLNSATTYYWRVQAANTGGAGPWSSVASFTTQSTVGIDRLETGLPTAFVLHDNYPNPFNPSTTIRFDIPEAAPVRLSVYDAVGRMTDVLVSETMQPGRYEVAWDAGDRPSGVFLYRLEAGTFRGSGSMILLK